MKPTSSKLPFRLLAVAGFSAAAFAGWQMAGGKSPTTNTPQGGNVESGKDAKAAARTERSARFSGPPAEARRKIAAIRSISSPQERMRATIALAYSLPSSELAEWIDKRWFISEPGFDLTLFNKIVNQRWQTEDPQGKLKLALEAGEGYSSNAVTAWAKQDAAGLLAWFKENPNPNIESQALNEIAKIDPALALKRLREMAMQNGSDYHETYYSSQTLRQIAEKSPELLEAALDSFPGSMRKNVEALLLAKRLKDDPLAEVHNLMQQPNGFKTLANAMNQSGGEREKLSEIFLSELSSLPEAWRKQISQGYLSVITPQNAEKWFNADFAAAGFSEAEAKNMRINALTNLTYNQPEQALKLIDQLDLDPSQRQSMISNLFSYNRDAKKTEELMAQLTNDADRKVAENYIAQMGQRPNSNGQIKAETPAEWFEAAQGYNPNNGSSFYFTNVLSNWDKDKMAEFATEFRKLSDDKKKSAAMVLASDHHNLEGSRELQGEAIRYLMSLPPPAEEGPQPGPDESGMIRYRQQQPDYAYTGSSFAVQWSMKDPDGASQWVQSLPEGESKLWVQKNLAMNWSKYDPDATKAWLGTLPANSRAEIEKFMKNPRAQQ